MKFFYHLSLSVAAALMSANSVVGATVAQYSDRAVFNAAVGTLTGSESFTDSWTGANSVYFASGFTASCVPGDVVNSQNVVNWLNFGSGDSSSLRIDGGNLRLNFNDPTKSLGFFAWQYGLPITVELLDVNGGEIFRATYTDGSVPNEFLFRGFTSDIPIKSVYITVDQKDPEYRPLKIDLVVFGDPIPPPTPSPTPSPPTPGPTSLPTPSLPTPDSWVLGRVPA